MRLIILIFAALLVGLLGPAVSYAAGSVTATESQTCWRGYTGGSPAYPSEGTCYSTPAAAATADGTRWAADRETSSRKSTFNGLTNDCTTTSASVSCAFYYWDSTKNSSGVWSSFVSNSTQGIDLTKKTSLVCPANSSGLSGTTCTCSTDYAANADGSACVSTDPCVAKSGTKATKNFTIGWSRTSGAEEESAWDYTTVSAGAALSNTSICDGTCKGTTAAKATDAWQSRQATAQGLYRLSVDYEVTYDGATCTSSDTTSEINPDVGSPTCSSTGGSVGQVGNKTVCVGSKGSSDAQGSADAPIKQGNPGAGSDGSSSIGTRSPGSSGGNDGGPSQSGDGQLRGGSGSSTDGTGGTGSSSGSDDGDDTEPCGLTDSTKCKIDESGTYTEAQGKAGMQSATDALSTSISEITAKIGSVGTGSESQQTLPWAPSSLLLPSGGCSAQVTETRLGPLKFDPCNSEIAQLWRELLGWLVYMLTMLYAWRSVVGSTGGK